MAVIGPADSLVVDPVVIFGRSLGFLALLLGCGHFSLFLFLGRSLSGCCLLLLLAFLLRLLLLLDGCLLGLLYFFILLFLRTCAVSGLAALRCTCLVHQEKVSSLLLLRVLH